MCMALWGLYSIQQQLDACVRLSRQVANLDYDYSSLETLQYLLRKIRLACGSVSQANLSPQLAFLVTVFPHSNRNPD